MDFPARLFPKGTGGVGGCAFYMQAHETHALHPSPVFQLKKILQRPNTAVFIQYSSLPNQTGLSEELSAADIWG